MARASRRDSFGDADLVLTTYGTLRRDAAHLSEVAFDYVILDAPPVAPVADALLIGNQTDGAVICVQGGKTSREQIARSHENSGAIFPEARTLSWNDEPIPVGTHSVPSAEVSTSRARALAKRVAASRPEARKRPARSPRAACPERLAALHIPSTGVRRAR